MAPPPYPPAIKFKEPPLYLAKLKAPPPRLIDCRLVPLYKDSL